MEQSLSYPWRIVSAISTFHPERFRAYGGRREGRGGKEEGSRVSTRRVN